MERYEGYVRYQGVTVLEGDRIPESRLLEVIKEVYHELRPKDTLMLAIMKGGVFSHPPFQMLAIKLPS